MFNIIIKTAYSDMAYFHFLMGATTYDIDAVCNIDHKSQY